MENIIILADDPSAFYLVHSKVVSLTGIQYEIETVSNGLEALDIINKYLNETAANRSCIFIDLRLHFIDRMEFIRALQGIQFRGGRRVIVVLTPSTDGPETENARKSGIKRFLLESEFERDLAGAISQD